MVTSGSRIIQYSRCLTVLLCAWLLVLAQSIHIDAEYHDVYRQGVECGSLYSRVKAMAGCHPQPGGCGRVVVDNFVGQEEIERLRNIAELSMQNATTEGGPTIADINTGYVRDQHRLMNIYDGGNASHLFTKDDYQFYRGVIEKIKGKVESEFGLTHLWFTAPTFITRLIGGGEPRGIHDEYWHPHVDKENNPVYDWSGLLYLSSFGEEFSGGVLEFHDRTTGEVDLTVEPRAGRLLVFSSGEENPHRVGRVTDGRRYVLSFWFTCDPRKQFKNWLDGSAHRAFSSSRTEL